jgi:hypothetical protein
MRRVPRYLVAGLFFLRFWRESRDRLFVSFSVAFLSILAGILEKNFRP